jgi:hypothetical protein
MGYAVFAMRRREEHPVLEGVGTERPGMAEDNWLTNLRP